MKQTHPPLLLIDADVPLYKASFASELETNWGDGLWTLHSDLENAEVIFRDELEKITEAFPKNYGTILCFSGSNNWRNAVLPEYKANRKKNRKPVVLAALRKSIEESYLTMSLGGLEADDILGLFSQSGIMVSIDKDLRTVAGFHYNPNKPDEGVCEVTDEEAHYNHMYQTLCGDTTDGYKGCPSVGPKTAEKILSALHPSDMWGAVTQAYEKKGLGEEDAMVQARVARILQPLEYDFSSGEVILWGTEEDDE